VIFLSRTFNELDALCLHQSVVSLKIIRMKKEGDSTAGLIADAGV